MLLARCDITSDVSLCSHLAFPSYLLQNLFTQMDDEHLNRLVLFWSEREATLIVS